MKHLQSIDKVVYHQATQGLTQAQRNHLVAIQSLGIWDNAKQLKFYREGDGCCPWCGANATGIVHEAWSCKALTAIKQQADPYLDGIGEHNTPVHILLGIPSQLIAEYDADFYEVLNGNRIPEGAHKLLKFNDTLGGDGHALLRRSAGFEGATANTVAYTFTCSTEEPIRLTVEPCAEQAPNEHDMFTDGALYGNGSAFPSGGLWSMAQGQSSRGHPSH